MINKTKYFYCLSFLMIIMSVSSFSQEEYIVNNSKFLQKTNSSYFGFNSLNKVGVLYNSMKINDFDKMDQKYFFGALSFENLDFPTKFWSSKFSTIFGNVELYMNRMINIFWYVELNLILTVRSIYSGIY